jgi:hypothetical protein
MLGDNHSVKPLLLGGYPRISLRGSSGGTEIVHRGIGRNGAFKPACTLQRSMLLRGVAINRITFRTPAHRPGTRSAARATGPDDSVTRGLQSALQLPKQLDLEGTGEAAASDDQAPPPPPLRNEDDPASTYVPPAMLTMDAAPHIISAATLERWEQAYRQVTSVRASRPVPMWRQAPGQPFQFICTPA